MFYLVFQSVRAFPLLVLFVVQVENLPAMPGMDSGRCAVTGTQLPSVRMGIFAVLKACDGDGLCRRLDARRSSSICTYSGDEEDLHGSDEAVVEVDALCNQTPRRTSL